MRSRAKRHCPFCAEEIQHAAIVCPECNRDIPSGAVDTGRAVVFVATVILGLAMGGIFRFGSDLSMTFLWFALGVSATTTLWYVAMPLVKIQLELKEIRGVLKDRDELVFVAKTLVDISLELNGSRKVLTNRDDMPWGPS
jgi:hypothetical protein